MDLKKMWGELEESDFGSTSEDAGFELAEIREASRHPLQKLRTKLKQKLYWGFGLIIAFMIGFAVIMTTSTTTEIGWSIGWILLVMSLLSLTTAVPTLVVYRKLPTLVDMGDNILQTLKAYRDTTKRVIRIENIFAYVMAVPAPTLGAWYGMLSGLEPGETMDSRRILVVLIVGILVSPLVVYLTKKFNKIALGKSLAEVEGLIAQMEEV